MSWYEMKTAKNFLLNQMEKKKPYTFHSILIHPQMGPGDDKLEWLTSVLLFAPILKTP